MGALGPFAGSCDGPSMDPLRGGFVCASHKCFHKCFLGTNRRYFLRMLRSVLSLLVKVTRRVLWTLVLDDGQDLRDRAMWKEIEDRMFGRLSSRVSVGRERLPCWPSETVSEC